MIRLFIVACVLFLACPCAEARHRAASPAACDNVDVMRPCAAGFMAKISVSRISPRIFRHRKEESNSKSPFLPSNEARKSDDARAEVIGGRPAGCPHAFCGCGSSLYKFGKIIPRLNLAAAWLGFPRASPAPGMAAVRRHHVMILVEQIGGDVWMVYDPNSGHHLIRRHARSIAGYAIVNPSL